MDCACHRTGRSCTWWIPGRRRVPSTPSTWPIPPRCDAGGRIFAELDGGGFDGIRCDADGNLGAAATGGAGSTGVHVFAADGDRIGQILLPESCANLCFGGAVGNRLFMTASRSVYSVFVNTRGA